MLLLYPAAAANSGGPHAPALLGRVASTSASTTTTSKPGDGFAEQQQRAESCVAGAIGDISVQFCAFGSSCGHAVCHLGSELLPGLSLRRAWSRARVLLMPRISGRAPTWGNGRGKSAGFSRTSFTRQCQHELPRANSPLLCVSHWAPALHEPLDRCHACSCSCADTACNAWSSCSACFADRCARGLGA